MLVEFMTRNGEVLKGFLTYSYHSFEGGMRHIIKCNGRDYRCIKDEDGNFVEYVA